MNREDLVCPGETIKELLEVCNYTQQDLANKLCMELKTTNEILNGKAPITIETAIKLEKIFDVDALFWCNLEFNYRKKLKEIEEREKIEKDYLRIKNVYKEMVNRNLVEETKDKYQIVDNFIKFMEVTSVDNLEQEYYNVACRKANTKNFDIINLMVWVQIGLKKAREIEIEEFNKEKILSRISEIRELTLLNDQFEARNQLIKICNECGIIVNFEKSMPNTAIYGIAKWLNAKTPFIQISDRGKAKDTFWFSFMHELGHIIKGRKKMIFLDMDNNEISDDKELQFLRDVEEAKADKFSMDILIPEKEYNEFLNIVEENNLNKKDIIDFSNKINISTCIVAGRLKHDKEMYDNKVLNSFNEQIQF
ncbi:MAG: ImmA/IrrE family metallo-endopeptidase [Clostridia bacterium]|nr:ImmA/IrrE family metallo-endopeptidase [Clostridia bacterium]